MSGKDRLMQIPLVSRGLGRSPMKVSSKNTTRTWARDQRKIWPLDRNLRSEQTSRTGLPEDWHQHCNWEAAAGWEAGPGIPKLNWDPEVGECVSELLSEAAPIWQKFFSNPLVRPTEFQPIKIKQWDPIIDYKTEKTASVTECKLEEWWSEFKRSKFLVPWDRITTFFSFKFYNGNLPW